MTKRKLVKAVAEEIKELTRKLIDDPVLVGVVNRWASKYNLVFKYPECDSIEDGFEIKSPGYDFSWKYFPGYKTVWVDHHIGISAKIGFNHNLKKPLGVFDVSMVSDDIK